MVLPLYNNLQKLHKGLSANLEKSGKKNSRKIMADFFKNGKNTIQSQHSLVLLTTFT